MIHLLGFLKAFQITDIRALSEPVTKPFGILWLISFLLFGITLFYHFKEERYWWAIALGAIVLSQILIFVFWQDARFGTILNAIILIVCIPAWAHFNFTNTINEERNTLLSSSKVDSNFRNNQKVNDLPVPVQKWLMYSRVLEKDIIDNVSLKQKIRMKLSPEQEHWNMAVAEQLFTIHPPAFNWSVNMQMNRIMSIQGRDKFDNGKAEMLMKIFSTIPVVNVKSNAKINQAALQRYLAEIVWFPSAALSSYINWEDINDQSAKATMTYGGTSGSGIFYFKENGEFAKFSAMRYKDSDEHAKQYEWIVEVIKTEEINGLKVPAEAKLTWRLENMDWTWLELEITELQHHTKKSMANKEDNATSR